MLKKPFDPLHIVLFAFLKKILEKAKIFFQSRKKVASLACRMQARSSDKEVKNGYDGSGKTASHT